MLSRQWFCRSRPKERSKLEVWFCESGYRILSLEESKTSVLELDWRQVGTRNQKSLLDLVFLPRSFCQNFPLSACDVPSSWKTTLDLLLGKHKPGPSEQKLTLMGQWTSLCSFATGFYKCFAFVIDGTDKDRGRVPWITKSGSPGKVIWGMPALGWLLYKTKLTRTAAKFLPQILHFIRTLSISLGFLRVEIPNSLGRVWNEFITYCLG